MKKYVRYMTKYVRNMKKYVRRWGLGTWKNFELFLSIGTNQSGASIFLDKSGASNFRTVQPGPTRSQHFSRTSLWTNQELAFSGPFSLNQSGASIFRIIQPQPIRSQHSSEPQDHSASMYRLQHTKYRITLPSRQAWTGKT